MRNAFQYLSSEYKLLLSSTIYKYNNHLFVRIMKASFSVPISNPYFFPRIATLNSITTKWRESLSKDCRSVGQIEWMCMWILMNVAGTLDVLSWGADLFSSTVTHFISVAQTDKCNIAGHFSPITPIWISLV